MDDINYCVICDKKIPIVRVLRAKTCGEKCSGILRRGWIEKVRAARELKRHEGIIKRKCMESKF